MVYRKVVSTEDSSPSLTNRWQINLCSLIWNTGCSTIIGKLYSIFFENIVLKYGNQILSVFNEFGFIKNAENANSSNS